LEATPDIVSITDTYGVHCYLNQSGQRMFNTSLEQVQRLNLTDLVHPDTANMLISQALPTAREKGIWSGESMIRNCFGKDIPVSHVIISHKSEEGLTERFSSIMRDISDRKAAETNLKKQSKELSQTLAQLKNIELWLICFHNALIAGDKPIRLFFFPNQIVIILAYDFFNGVLPSNLSKGLIAA
ncbi:MAG: PAS domain-containing protein, partial [Cyanobacteria bacterium J06598_1]